MHTGCWWKNVKEKDQQEDLGVDGRKHQNECQNKRIGGCELDSSGSRRRLRAVGRL
jgi:hypothetical protein